MIVTMSRQDLQGVVDYAKNRIIERLVTKYDVQNAANSAVNRVMDNINDLRRDNQPVIRQTLALTEQTAQRTQILDARLSSIEQELKEMNSLLSRVVGQQNRAVTLQRY